MDILSVALLDHGSAVIYLVLALFLWQALLMLRQSFFLFSLVSLPGTFLHELSHALIGTVMLAKPSSFSLWPKRVGNQYLLGSVEMANIRWYNGLFVGLSPLLLLPGAVALALWRTEHFIFSPAEFAWLYLCATVLGASLPSIQDIKVALRASWVVIIIFLFGLAYHFRILGMK